jgi:pimeloyl-ACP methyl ester carboxylesterase
MLAAARKERANRAVVAMGLCSPRAPFRSRRMDARTQLSRSQDIAAKISRVLQRRTQVAQENLSERLGDALGRHQDDIRSQGAIPASFDPLHTWQYVTDVAQRSLLFWDTLYQRGTEFVERSAGNPTPVLHFEYDIVLDGRKFKRPVNYALLQLRPPAGVDIDVKKRPYLIIDPRAGHGPGIGGFKDDSQAGVALRAGHPVFFVVFFRDPEPGQTMLDVCSAEQQFVRKVRSLHPESPKPAVIGNCQGGWAAMMLASSDPDETGPIVINGAPMSYWSGAWSEGEGDNPMRYAGGLLGGSWLASYAADLGNGKFDGAHLVQNFENLNPANTFWEKYYHLFANIDTEPARFLEFERWWGSYYLMNREEIEWITRNLFVGNKLWSGGVSSAHGEPFDLRKIRSPIVLFASMGDNITPPQQAFNWVVDLYKSTEEIKSRGQVIVGLMHEDIGHLGIFVSGRVAKKEHKQIVSVLETIETFPPGLYGMSINEVKGGSGETEYEVEFRECRLEDISAHFNRFGRVDEKPFEAVAALSELNQRVYELVGQPVVQAMSNETSARMLREFHPLRLQRWALSGMNPWLGWLHPAAQAVRESRQPAAADNPWRKLEETGSEIIGASLDYYRAMRDAATEAGFFGIYANMYSMFLADRSPDGANVETLTTGPRDTPFVQAALQSINEGGYTEALARAAFLLARKGASLPLARLEMRKELAEIYADYLPDISADQWRRIRGVQEIIARYEPEAAIATLPTLLTRVEDRERFLELLGKLMADERVLNSAPDDEQLAALENIRAVLVSRVGRKRQGSLPDQVRT